VVDTHAKVVVKGCSLVWLLLRAELYWGEFCGAQRVWTFAFRVARECIVFISSVGSFSIVSSELKKETLFVFFEQQVLNKHHRLVAVK
jgi:hypothetical protein